MNYTEIKIDLEVYKMIEAERINFSESPNDILRRKYSVPNTKAAPITQKAVVSSGSRTTGHFSFTYKGSDHSEASLKAAYRKCLILLAADIPSFLDAFSKKETSGRRYVSLEPNLLYKKSPHLTEQHAEELTEGYWYDTNLSQQQVSSRLATACDVANIEFGSTLKLHF